MLGSSLSLLLLGLGAVHAAPTKTSNEPRQGGTWGIGDPSTTLWPGDQKPPVGCNPYLWAYWGECIRIGGSSFRPGKRQTFTLPPGAGSDKKHAIEVLEQQLIQLQNKRHKTQDDYREIEDLKAAIRYLAGVTDISAPPGTGSTFTPGKAKRQTFVLPPGADKDKKHAIEQLELQLIQLQNKKHKTSADYEEIASLKAAIRYLAGVTDISAPPGTGSTFTPGKRQTFTLPPGADKDKKHAIEQLELQLIQLQNKKHKTSDDYEEIASLKAAIRYLAGVTDISAPPGTGSTFTPGKRQTFTLPPGDDKDKKHAIEQLELQLIQLQNKKHKTDDDYEEIESLKAAIRYLAGVTDISAPPGTGSTFTPGRRQTIGGGGSDKTAAIIELEKQLVALQNKPNKTDDDLAQIAALKAMIAYTEGISDISAPPGTETSFHGGKAKRQTITLPNGDYSSACPGLEGAELAFERLLHATSDRKPTVSEFVIMKKLERFLNACGVKIITSPDGTSTVIYPSTRKRDVALPAAGKPAYDLAGLEKAYEQLLQNPNPNFTTWMAMAQLADLLSVWGIRIEQSPPGTTTTLVPSTRRQVFAIGGKACELANVMGMKAALAALELAYGDPRQTAREIYLIEQFLVTALQACGHDVPGWTTITPGNPIPGGPIVPDPTVPGGPIKPDPTVPGGPIKPDPYQPGGPMIPDPTTPGGEVKPSDKKARQTIIGDPAALLAALHELEGKYGSYGSGTIPGPIFLIMQNMVFILQDTGVEVPGWPVLGKGSVIIGPSN